MAILPIWNLPPKICILIHEIDVGKEESMAAPSMEAIVSLCKRRGFIFPGSEIYGGLQGTYDYGPLGVELKRNLKEAGGKCST